MGEIDSGCWNPLSEFLGLAFANRIAWRMELTLTNRYTLEDACRDARPPLIVA